MSIRVYDSAEYSAYSIYYNYCIIFTVQYLLYHTYCILPVSTTRVGSVLARAVGAREGRGARPHIEVEDGDLVRVRACGEREREGGRGER
jgi:hypothetical protein